MRGMTQKYLGMLVGFPEGSADVRLAQYDAAETGAGTEFRENGTTKFMKGMILWRTNLFV